LHEEDSMDIVIEEKFTSDEYTIIALSGRLSGANAPEFKNRIREIIKAGKSRIILDMADVTFIDSSGLSALISGLKYAREAGGFLRLVALQDQAFKVIKLMLLDRVFEIYKNIDEAVRS